MSDEPIMTIGMAAGVVYRELEKGERNLAQLKKQLSSNGYDANTLLMAIGWLAREDKIEIKKSNKWEISLK